MKNRSVLYALAALTILVALIFIIRQTNKSSSAAQSSTSTVKEYSFVLKDKKLLSGPDKISVTEGDQVKITLSSDADYPELHLHGYEIMKEIKKDTPTIMALKADKTGSYVLEVHFVEDTAGRSNSSNSSGSVNELQISHLEVQPK